VPATSAHEPIRASPNASSAPLAIFVTEGIFVQKYILSPKVVLAEKTSTPVSSSARTNDINRLLQMERENIFE
jgi:hypothetical protein